MKHSLRGLLALVMLSGAVLACGLPLPSALVTGGIVIPACAAGEEVETCALRQGAFERLAATEALAVESFSTELFMDNAGELMQLVSTGRYTYAVSDDPAGFGANVHVWIDSVTVEEDGVIESFSDLQIILIGAEAYWSEDGGATWTHETLTGDEDTQLGVAAFIGLLAPLTGEIDLFANPDAFVVQVGKADGGIQRHMLTVNFDALISDADSVLALLAESMAVDENLGIGLGIEDLGEPAQVAAMAPMLVEMLGMELAYSARIGIDAASGQMVSFGETFGLDMSVAENEGMRAHWVMDATLGSYDDVAPVEAPAEYSEGDMGDIFGSPLN